MFFDGGTDLSLTMEVQIFRFPTEVQITDLLLTFSLTRFQKKMDFLNLTTVSDRLHTGLSYFIFNQQVQIFCLRWRYRSFVFRRPSYYRESRCDVVHYSDSVRQMNRILKIVPKKTIMNDSMTIVPMKEEKRMRRKRRTTNNSTMIIPKKKGKELI